MYIYHYPYILLIYIFFFCACFVVVFFLNRLFRVHLEWRKYITPSHSSWMMKGKEGFLQERKSADAALKSAETQAKSQRKLANEVKGQLVAAKEQIAALR